MVLKRDEKPILCPTCRPSELMPEIGQQVVCGGCGEDLGTVDAAYFEYLRHMPEEQRWRIRAPATEEYPHGAWLNTCDTCRKAVEEETKRR